MRITDMITQNELLDILSTSSHCFFRKGQQMRIPILILGFKGLKELCHKFIKIQTVKAVTKLSKT